jgi:hypothetical protein
MAERRKDLARLMWLLRSLRRNNLSHDQLLARLNAAKAEVGNAFQFIHIGLPPADQPVTRETFTFALNKAKLALAELEDKRAS